MTFDGHVIARVFPAVKTDKKQSTPSSRNPKPPHASFDPATLKPNAGHLAYRPTPRVKYEPSASWKDLLDVRGNMTLDVYLYPRKSEIDSHETVHLQLNRDSKELLSKTLTRLDLSLAKKLDQLQKSALSNKSKTHHVHSQTPSVAPQVVTLDTDSTEPLDTWDITTLTNGEWIQQLIEKPCMLQLHAENDDDMQAKRHLLVEPCPPTIVGVQTFENFDGCLFAGIPIRVKVEICFADGCSVDWFVVGNDGTANLIVKDSPLFTPTDDLVGASLAVLLTPFNANHDGRGQEEAYRFKRQVQSPSDNTVLQLRTPAWTTPTAPDKLRVVSYNILADQNAFQTGNQMPFYPYCSKDILERARRFPLILQELVSYHPDIMCLQEVDQIVFETLLQPVLSSVGWDGYYTMKRHAGTREGCAVFWSKDRFELIEQHWFNLGDLSNKLHVRPTGSDWSPSLQSLDRLLKTQKSLKYVIKAQLGHVAQMIRLMDRHTQQQLLVVNTHLFYHPDASHVRLIQMLLIARQLSTELDKDKSNVPHVILCGDFNSSLENAAGKLIVDRKVAANFRDLKTHLNTFDFGVAKASAPAKTDFDFPAFELPSSFPHLRSALVDPPAFTHCIDGFRANLDHILTTMESVQHAPMPSLEQVTKNVAMPSENLPSDHISIVCDLKY